MLKNKETIILSAAFIVGLLVRVLLLTHPAMHDILVYTDWGRDALTKGLAKGFHGIYFPIQYQIFELSLWVGQISGIDFQVVLRFIGLFFDIGNFILLTMILKTIGGNKLFAILYWLHPWFVIIFAEGYVDCQFVFFVLLTLYILLQGKTLSNYFWAGVPLGIAFLMKPQAQMLVFAAAVFALVGFIRRRKFDQFLILAAPAILFLGYDLYFFVNLFPALGVVRALVFLPRKYLGIQGEMAVLTGNMLNFWYPIAYFMKQPGTPIYSVGSDKFLLPFVQFRVLASLVVITLVSWYTFLVQRLDESKAESGGSILLIFAFVSLVVPFLMTSAHENHLYLGTVLLVILLAKFGGRLFNLAIQLTLIIQFVNIYLMYFNDRLANFLLSGYSLGVRTILAVISALLFIFLVKKILTFNFSSSEQIVAITNHNKAA